MEILASDVDGMVRRFDVRMSCMETDHVGARFWSGVICLIKQPVGHLAGDRTPTWTGANCRAEILASSVDGTVRRFDVRMGCMDVDQLGAPVTAMALSHDGNCVLASCLDGRMRLLDKASGELLAQYSGAALC